MNWSDNIQVFNEDCMEVMKRYPDNYFDLAVVDPPYGIGMDGGNVGYKGFNDFVKKEWDKTTPNELYFNQLIKSSKDQIIWGGNYFNLSPSRCFLVWDKGEGFYNRTYAECELAWTSFNKNTRKYKYDPLCNGDYKGKIHPTQKPVALYSWIFYNYAKPDFKILDTHGGSFSSAIAWHRYSKGQGEFIGVELDKEYYDAAYKRFKEQTAQLTLL